jgi:hypothetical protein
VLSCQLKFNFFFLKPLHMFSIFFQRCYCGQGDRISLCPTHTVVFLTRGNNKMRALKNRFPLSFYEFCQFFRKFSDEFCNLRPKIRSFYPVLVSKQPQKRLSLRCLPRILISGRTSPPYTVITRKILSPLKILYAACRYQQSTLFFAIVVNRALLAPS